YSLEAYGIKGRAPISDSRRNPHCGHMRKAISVVASVLLFCGAVFTSRSAVTNSVSWMDDALPAGGVPGTQNDSWSWVASNPAPISGRVAHQSSISGGFHQHWFDWGSPLVISQGDILFAYVYIDPANVPSEVMLHWYDGSWEHR